jgi:hypothetical protein
MLIAIGAWKGPEMTVKLSVDPTVDPKPSRPSPVTGAANYADVRDRSLAAKLLAEDQAEEAGLDPLERITCRTHRRWLHRCISSPVHVIIVTGHRWCRTCSAPASVAVDELTGDVRVSCTRCGLPPAGRATRQIIRACMASVAAALDGKSQGTSRLTPDMCYS